MGERQIGEGNEQEQVVLGLQEVQEVEEGLGHELLKCCSDGGSLHKSHLLVSSSVILVSMSMMCGGC